MTALAALVEKTIAEDPYELDGFAWAARPQSFYCAELSISTATLRRLISEPPFVRLPKLVGDGPVVISGKKQISGPVKMTLLRTGEAPPKSIADTANETKKIMIAVWKKTTGHPVTQDQTRLLWGMALDMMGLCAELGLPVDAAGELSIAVIKYALADWKAVATATKFAAQSTPGYKPRFYDYPSIANIRRFYKAAVHAYAMHLQETKAAPPAGLEFLTKPNVAGAITAATNPMLGLPALTPAMEAAWKANMEGGYAAAAKKALAVSEPTGHMSEPGE
jgi:hypothetical protein